VSFVARQILQKTFATVMDAVSHPNFINWLAGELKGSPQQRMMAKEALNNRLRLGGGFGAATGQNVNEQLGSNPFGTSFRPSQEEDDTAPPPPQVVTRFVAQGNPAQ
jgi:hypothetical protein